MNIHIKWYKVMAEHNIHKGLWIQMVYAQLLSYVWLFVAPWTVDCQAPIHGIFQARILEWLAIFYSKGSSQPMDQTLLSCIPCIGRQSLYH